MPIEWTLSTDARTVEAVWSGQVSADDWQRFIEDMRRSRLVGHPKLHDLSQAAVNITPAQIRDLARFANEVADDQALGPVAFVIDSAHTLELVMQFDDGTASSIRPIAMFPTRQLAIEWLDGMRSAP
ncbi:MAG: hypothetical protein AB7O88_05165 [Reyranellaceae bacterium]